MAETWLDVIAPSLQQGIDVNKPVPPQFDIGLGGVARPGTGVGRFSDPRSQYPRTH